MAEPKRFDMPPMPEGQQPPVLQRPSLRVFPSWECVFTGGAYGRSFIRVPDDLQRLGLGPEDVGMELRGMCRYWQVYEFTSAEDRAYWWTDGFREWSFFAPIPAYLVILLVHETPVGYEVVNRFSVVSQNIPGEVPREIDAYALGIWIESDEDLEQFYIRFFLDLDFPDERPEAMAKFDAQMLANEVLTAEYPTPMDYVSRYWEQVPAGERRAFLLTTLLSEDILTQADIAHLLCYLAEPEAPRP